MLRSETQSHEWIIESISKSKSAKLSHYSIFEKAKQEHVLTITRAGIHCVPVGGALHRSNGCGGREGGGRGGDGGGDPVVQPPSLPLRLLFLLLVIGRGALHRLDLRHRVYVTLGDNGSPLLAGGHGSVGGGHVADGGGREDCGRGRARNEEKLGLA